MDQSPTAKFIVEILGDAGVGKRAIADRYCLDRFASDPVTTGDSTVKTIEVEGQDIILDIRTAEDPYISLSDDWYQAASGFLLVYDVTCAKSFALIEPMYREVRERGHKFQTVVIAGNKCDEEKDREMTDEEGHNLAMKLHCGFAELSAKRDTGLEEMFNSMAGQMLALNEIKEELEAHQIAKKNRKRRHVRRFSKSWKRFRRNMDDFWNEILCWILGYDRRLVFTPVPPLEHFQL